MRTLFGDEEVVRRAPMVMNEGIPCGAIAHLLSENGQWSLIELGDTTHLPAELAAGHRPV
jgi:hypothetical protein